jgi:SanA protein
MLKRALRIFVVIFTLLIIVLVWVVNNIVVDTTKNQLYTDVNAIPKNKAGLLLGTSKYKDKGRNILNPYYQNRIDAAVALYMAGKIDYIIVSGDNSASYYNEPLLMKNDLIAKGVPANRIYMDDAGFRTLDSVLRCSYIFGQDRFTIISQRFHNERALYIANHKNLHAVAFNAQDGDSFFFEQLREKQARVKMMLDLLVNKQARFYGEPIKIK